MKLFGVMCSLVILYSVDNVFAMHRPDDRSYSSANIRMMEIVGDDQALVDINDLADWFLNQLNSINMVDVFIDNQHDVEQVEHHLNRIVLNDLSRVTNGEIYDKSYLDLRRVFSHKLRRYRVFPHVKKLLLNIRQLCDQRVKDRLFSSGFALDEIESLSAMGGISRYSKFYLMELMDRTPNLKELDLSKAGLTNWIRPINYLFNLEYLNLGFNKLTFISRSIRNLKKLKILNLESNELTAVPEDVCELSHLEVLNISKNRLILLPSTLELLKSLRIFNIKNNIIIMPDEIGSVQNLKELNLGDNGLVMIPIAIGNLINLTKLDLDNNEISTVPIELSKLKNLEILNLSHNDIAYISNALYKLDNLKELDLSFNKLINVPGNILNLKRIEKLYLNNNKLKFSNDMPTFLAKMTYYIIRELPKLKELRIEKSLVSQLPTYVDIYKNPRLVLELLLSWKNKRALSRETLNKLLDDISIHKEIITKVYGNKSSQAKIYLRHIDSSTPLSELILCGHVNALQWLLDNREIDLKFRNQKGKTILQVVEKALRKSKKWKNKKYKEILACLKQHGAKQ